MIMKKFLCILFAAFSTAFCPTQAQTPPYLWPVKDAQPGTGIVSAPGGSIDNEPNYDRLFITAPEGAVVVSPIDGTIERLSVGYVFSLAESSSHYYEGSFDQSIECEKTNLRKSEDPKYLHGLISIKTNDGNKITIRGLCGDETFKTGQRIRRGEPIGRMGFSYHKIKEPSISVQISDRKSRTQPMAPFGLKSSIIGTETIKPILSLTNQQAREDFLILIDALKEAYPGLYKAMTAEELSVYVDNTLTYIDSFDSQISFGEFWKITKQSIARIRDAHLWLNQPEWLNSSTIHNIYKPKIRFGWINDTLICTNALPEYGHLIGQEITRFNGMTADSMRSLIASGTAGYDADSKAYLEFTLATTGFLQFFEPPYGNGSCDMTVELASGETAQIKGELRKNARPYMNNWAAFEGLNKYESGYELKVLNDSTALVGLSKFSLNQVAVERIAQFIDSISSRKKHLIIDLRNNAGGDSKTVTRLFSYIALDTLKLGGYTRVNKKGWFESFNYSLNRVYDDEVFPEYIEQPGKEGYYYHSDLDNITAPDTAVNFRGKVYVLTNERSFSAATVFAAMVVRSHRGVTVGRETPGAYHVMNALKFAEMRLPNSTFVVRVPLVEIVFDTIVNDRVPYGRGVLPDYTVPLTLDELSYTNGDAILNYTLELIREGRYFPGDNPFEEKGIAQEAAGAGKCNTLLGVVGAVVIAGGIVGFIAFRNRKRKKA